MDKTLDSVQNVLNLFNNQQLPKESLESLESGFENFAQILAMPPELFVVAAEIILEEHTKELNKPENKLALILSLKENDRTIEDFYEMCDALTEEIQTILGDQTEQVKIDFLKRLVANIRNCVSENESIRKRVVVIPIQKLHDDAVIPNYAHTGDAGVDVYTLEEYTIMPGETKIIPTGLKVALPAGYELQVRPRSGQSAKTKLRIANSPGTIDSGFRGEIGIIVDNIDQEIKNVELYNGELVLERGAPITISKGQKIAQLVLSEAPTALFQEVAEINEVETDRSIGGFGSTDG